VDISRILIGLNNLQADGRACVVCGLIYYGGPVPPRAPVGWSDTGSRVFACLGKCTIEAQRRQEG